MFHVDLLPHIYNFSQNTFASYWSSDQEVWSYIDLLAITKSFEIPDSSNQWNALQACTPTSLFGWQKPKTHCTPPATCHSGWCGTLHITPFQYLPWMQRMTKSALQQLHDSPLQSTTAGISEWKVVMLEVVAWERKRDCKCSAVQFEGDVQEGIAKYGLGVAGPNSEEFSVQCTIQYLICCIQPRWAGNVWCVKQMV